MLIQLRNIHLSYGQRELLDGLNLQIEAGERIALVGRNGSGKSTLMKIIDGQVRPDDGHVDMPPGTRVARLEQEVPRGTEGPVFEIVAQGLGEVGEALAQYHALAQQMAQGDHSAQLGAALSRAQHTVDANDGWTLNQQVEEVLSRLELDGEAAFESLSGGLKRRVLMARALVHNPDLLLLDEPTNHLDIEAIAALEQLLLEWSGSLLFITHDRAFLKRLATRIVDLDRGKLSSWPGNYASYLSGKAKALEDEAAADRLFDKRLAEEEVWIRQGIKARRTRNEGRVRALKALREERAQRREKMGTVNLRMQDLKASGKQVIVAEGVNFSWGEKPVIRDFSAVIQRGDKVGIIGPNGVGKTTLIQILLGELAPQSGSLELGSRVAVAHFDQHRAGLDLDATVADNVAEGHSYVDLNGQSKHVISYLQDFLFSPERARTPVRVLSGGERNRLLLAKLFTRPANLLVMDEPTNDLDVETLELLEERLIDYPGTLLLVSHDRDFIDNVVTSSLVFEGQGRIGDYVGGYSDWLRQRPRVARSPQAASTRSSGPPPSPVAKTPAARGAGLSPKLHKELAGLPARIEQLETALETAQAVFAEPGFFARPETEQAAAQAALAACESKLSQAMMRWEELEKLATE